MIDTTTPASAFPEVHMASAGRGATDADRDRDELRNRAKRMKHQGDHRDVDILESLILAVTSGGDITED